MSWVFRSTVPSLSHQICSKLTLSTRLRTQQWLGALQFCSGTDLDLNLKPALVGCHLTFVVVVVVIVVQAVWSWTSYLTLLNFCYPLSHLSSPVFMYSPMRIILGLLIIIVTRLNLEGEKSLSLAGQSLLWEPCLGLISFLRPFSPRHVTHVLPRQPLPCIAQVFPKLFSNYSTSNFQTFFFVVLPWTK